MHILIQNYGIFTKIIVLQERISKEAKRERKETERPRKEEELSQHFKFCRDKNWEEILEICCDNLKFVVTISQKGATT